MARVQVLKETVWKETGNNPASTDWTLWFQWCRYIYDDTRLQHGYRFIWKRPESEGGSLQAARGQARIPSVTALEQLVAQARADGWADHDAEDFDD